MKENLVHALAKIGGYLAERNTRPGLLARQLLGRDAPGDTKVSELLVNERRARSRMDGSIAGSLVKTAWAAWEMMDLGTDGMTGGLDRLVAWTLAQAPVTLPNGAVFAEPAAAAFAARCLGLRVVLRARKEARPAVARLIAQLADGPQPATLDLSASALAALALVPPPHRRHLDGLVQRLGKAQGAAGDWPDADLFHMLEGLVLAGIRPARAVVARAAPALLARLGDDGGFDRNPPGDPVREERSLIGLRALQVALED